jgi:hypothetical protein
MGAQVPVHRFTGSWVQGSRSCVLSIRFSRVLECSVRLTGRDGQRYFKFDTRFLGRSQELRTPEHADNAFPGYVGTTSS